MQRSQKVGLAFLFSLAGITIAFDILRTVKSLSANGQQELYEILETNISVIAACLPTYRSLLKTRPKSKFNRLNGAFLAETTICGRPSNRDVETGSTPKVAYSHNTASSISGTPCCESPDITTSKDTFYLHLDLPSKFRFSFPPSIPHVADPRNNAKDHHITAT